MTAISVCEVQATLSQLIHRLTPGEELLLTEDDRPVAKLVATVSERNQVPKLGTQRGSVIYMAPDFDIELDDFKEYME